MFLIKELHAFFQQKVEVDKKGWVHFIWTEGEDTITLSADEWNELNISWEKNSSEIVNVQNIAISNVFIIDDEFDTSLQFILERQPSRMFRVQLKPSLHVSFEMHFEVCEDCDEEE